MLKTLSEDIARLKELCKPWGYVTFIDKDGKWHCWELLTSGDDYPNVILGEGYAIEMWVMPNVTRYQALKVAKQDYNTRPLLSVSNQS